MHGNKALAKVRVYAMEGSIR